MNHESTFAFIALVAALPLSLAQSPSNPGTPLVPGASAMKLQTALTRLQDVRHIRAVRFVMDIPFAEHAVALDRDSLERTGCRFASADPLAIAAVTRLLRDAGLSSPAAPQPRELRQVLDVDDVDGTTLTFEFGEVFPSDDATRGAVDGTPLAAPSTLQADLFKWARALPGPRSDCSDALARLF